MRKEKSKPQTCLKSWIFTKPVLFVLSFLGLSLVSSLICSLIQTLLGIDTLYAMYVLCGLAFILSVYYMIRKLPCDKISQSDSIAIINAASIISIISSIIAITGIGLYGHSIQRSMLGMYILRPSLFFVLFSFIVLFSLYMVGLAISSIYAKYKRAVTIGISPWKVILSLPFTFLLMWTPGYLIQDRSVKSELEIKSRWYSKFNKWVISNFNNTFVVFLFILLCKSLIAGIPTLILSLTLLIIYTIWYTKHESDFIKNINSGYALTAVGINLAILLAVLTQIL